MKSAQVVGAVATYEAVPPAMVRPERHFRALPESHGTCKTGPVSL